MRPTPPSHLPRRPVGEGDDARTERLRLYELEPYQGTSLPEEALSAAHDHGMDHEPELVEEAVPQQVVGQRVAADHRDVLARLPLQVGHPLRDVLPDKSRVVPTEGLLEGRRDDELGHAVYAVDP